MATPDDMTCGEVVDLVSEYLEGRMAAADRARFDAHLELCPYRKEYVTQMKATIEALGGLSEDTIPEERRAELIEAFRGWKDR